MDLGLKRVGLAISDPSGTLARPLRTIERGSSDTTAAAVLAEAVTALGAEDEGVEVIVVGLPKRLDGSDTEQTQHVRRMVDQLRTVLAVPIVLQDERLSSHEADSRLALTERDWRKRKARLDAASAAVILQDYLDGRTVPTPSHAAIED